jgi:hypothetical protein
LGAEFGRLFEQETGCAGRINYGVIDNAQATGHSRAQIRLGFCDIYAVENFDANAALAEKFLFAVNFCHFFIVSREPEGAARVIFDVGGELWNELLPECARKMGERKLGIGIVHDNDVAHPGSGSSACDWTAIENQDLQTAARAFSGARSADNSSADDDEVEGFGHGNR